MPTFCRTLTNKVVSSSSESWNSDVATSLIEKIHNVESQMLHTFDNKDFKIPGVVRTWNSHTRVQAQIERFGINSSQTELPSPYSQPHHLVYQTQISLQVHIPRGHSLPQVNEDTTQISDNHPTLLQYVNTKSTEYFASSTAKPRKTPNIIRLNCVNFSIGTPCPLLDPKCTTFYIRKTHLPPAKWSIPHQSHIHLHINKISRFHLMIFQAFCSMTVT